MNKKYFRLLQFSLLVAIAILYTSNYSYAADDNSDAVLDLINEKREEQSLAPLKVDNSLMAAAEVRSEEIVTSLNHSRPDGSPWYTVYPDLKGENIAAGIKDPEKLVDAWMGSESHRSNILNSQFETVGIGHLTTNNTYKNYWVLLFGEWVPEKIVLQKIRGLKATVKSTTVTIQWKTQSIYYATGYQLFQYNPSNGKYYLMKIMDKNTVNKVKIIKLGYYKEYKFLVRSYKIANGKTYYGEGSKVTVVTNKKKK